MLVIELKIVTFFLKVAIDELNFVSSLYADALLANHICCTVFFFFFSFHDSLLEMLSNPTKSLQLVEYSGDKSWSSEHYT